LNPASLRCDSGGSPPSCSAHDSLALVTLDFKIGYAALL
jgi:hypothetical protein